MTADELQAAAEAREAEGKELWIQAALGKAMKLLPPDATFALVWATAAEAEPEAFGYGEESSRNSKRIVAALVTARDAVGAEAPFEDLWKVASEAEPAAFNF